MELNEKINDMILRNKISHNLPKTIITKLEEISALLEKNSNNPNEFGQNIFGKYISTINEFGRVTSYEISSSRILTNLLNFIFNMNNSEKPSPLQSSGSKSKPQAIEEEKKESGTKDDANVKQKIELTDQQCRSIIGRLISFIYFFKKPKNSGGQEVFLHDFIKNLQEMLSNCDKFTRDVSRSYSEQESSLNADLRFLCQRSKFKV
jgi:hypothetical protein